MLEVTLCVNGTAVKQVYGNVTDYIDGADEITIENFFDGDKHDNG